MIRGTGTGEQPGLVPAGLLLRTAAATRKDPKTTAWRLFEASLSKGRSTEAGSKKGATDQATFPNTDRSTLEAVTWIGGPTKGGEATIEHRAMPSEGKPRLMGIFGKLP